MIYRKENVEKIAEDKATAARLEKQGYVCISGAPRKAGQETPPARKSDLTTLTVQELRNMAKARGIKGASALSKKDLLQVLQ